jgi:hypothetical protein
MRHSTAILALPLLAVLTTAARPVERNRRDAVRSGSGDLQLEELIFREA